MTVIIAYNSDNPVEIAAASVLDVNLKELMPDAKRVEGPVKDGEQADREQAIVYVNKLIQLPQQRG